MQMPSHELNKRAERERNLDGKIGISQFPRVTALQRILYVAVKRMCADITSGTLIVERSGIRKNNFRHSG